MTSKVVSDSLPPRLSVRQIECLTRVAAGVTSAEIALALGVSRRTVDEPPPPASV